MMMMKLRDGLVRHLLLASVAFFALAGATTPLKPLVVRNEQQFGPIPAECEQGIASAPVLRVDLSQIPLPPPAEPPENTAPPSGELRSSLDATQTALARNDRPAFDTSLARARDLLAGYPSGAERRAAEDLVRIYEASRRLWDAQYASPFFAEASPEYQLVSGFPGYAEAVKRSIWTDADGTRFYPAAESRDFLSRIAAERLQRLGINSRARSVRSSDTAAAGTPRSAPATRRSISARRDAAASSGPTHSGTQRSTSRRTPSPSSTRSASTRPSSHPASRSSSTTKPAAAPSSPVSPRQPASPSVAAVPAPATSVDTKVATSPAAGGSTSQPVPSTTAAEPAPSPATDTDLLATASETASAGTETAATSGTDSSATETAMSASTETGEGTTTETIPATTTQRGRSVVLPAILILVGLGVLIVLFRASS